MNTHIIKSLLIFLWLTVLLPLSACALSGGSIDGKVVEEGTNKPIPNAIVVVQWVGNLWAVVESQTVCVHALTTTTDAQGRFHFPAWAKASTIGPVTGVEPSITVYYPGYTLVRLTPPPSSERFSSHGYPLEPYPLGLFGIKPTTLHLAPFTGARRERLEYLQKLSSATGCYSGGESEKSLLALRTALYDEARQLARPGADQKIIERHGTDETIIMPFPHEKTDQEIIESLRYEMEIIEYGYETAERRHLQRLGAER